MAGIERTGIRLTIEQQVGLRRMNQAPAGKTWSDFRGRPLTLGIIEASGRFLRAGEVLAAGVAGISGAIAAAASRILAVLRPEMVTSAKLSFNVMKAPVTVAMFEQFVADEATKPNGYKITGHNADKLIALLADTKKSDHALTYVNYEDATAFVNWRKEKTGQDLRMPTEDEWLAAKREVGNQLTGSMWEWTQTIYNGITRVLRSLNFGNRLFSNPDNRYFNFSLRLVEDKK